MDYGCVGPVRSSARAPTRGGVTRMPAARWGGVASGSEGGRRRARLRAIEPGASSHSHFSPSFRGGRVVSVLPRSGTGGEQHDAGVEGLAEFGHRGNTFLYDSTPSPAAEFVQEEGSLRLGKPIADDVARFGDIGTYRLVDNVDVLEVGSLGRSAHGGRGAQLTVDGLEELVPLRRFPSRPGHNAVDRCLRR